MLVKNVCPKINPAQGPRPPDRLQAGVRHHQPRPRRARGVQGVWVGGDGAGGARVHPLVRLVDEADDGGGAQRRHGARVCSGQPRVSLCRLCRPARPSRSSQGAVTDAGNIIEVKQYSKIN